MHIRQLPVAIAVIFTILALPATAENYYRWLDENGRKHHLQYGYRNIPDDILIPYSIADADVTYRCLIWLLQVVLKQAGQLKTGSWCCLRFNAGFEISLRLAPELRAHTEARRRQQ